MTEWGARWLHEHDSLARELGLKRAYGQAIKTIGALERELERVSGSAWRQRMDTEAKP